MNFALLRFIPVTLHCRLHPNDVVSACSKEVDEKYKFNEHCCAEIFSSNIVLKCGCLCLFKKSKLQALVY